MQSSCPWIHTPLWRRIVVPAALSAVVFAIAVAAWLVWSLIGWL